MQICTDIDECEDENACGGIGKCKNTEVCYLCTRNEYASSQMGAWKLKQGKFECCQNVRCQFSDCLW